MKTYSYAGVVFHLSLAPEIERQVLRLLGDYIVEADQSTSKTAFTLAVRMDRSSRDREIIEYGKPTLIHVSRKPSVHESGYVLDVGLLRWVYNCSTKGVYQVNYLSESIEIWNIDSEALCRDTIRVVRDFLKRSVEVRRGGLLLHAAATVSPTGVGVLLISGKGGGKSTVMLNLIYRHGFREVSRDRTFIVSLADGTFRAYGFPNYYNLGPRTLATFPETRHLIPESMRHMDNDALNRVAQKWEFLPDQIGISREHRNQECNVSHLVFLEIEGADVSSTLAGNCFTPHDANYANWHEWHEPSIPPVDGVSTVLHKFLQTPHVVCRWKSDLDSAGAHLTKIVSIAEAQ